MNLQGAITQRHSIRAYTTEQISEEALDAILAAGSAAPIGMRRYEDLHITVIQDKALLARISKAAAAERGTDDDPLYAAPTLVLISHAPTEKPGMDFVDAACIGENMALAATEQGVGSVIIWSTAKGIAADKDICTDMGLPEGFNPCLGIVFGISAMGELEAKDLSFRLVSNRV